MYGIKPRPGPARRYNKNAIESKHKIIRDIFLKLSFEKPEELGPLYAQQALRITNDLYGNDVVSATELAKGYTRPIESGVLQRGLPAYIVSAHDTLVAKRKLTKILRSKTTQDEHVSPGDMVEVFIKRENEKRGKWSAAKPVLEFDAASGIVILPGTIGHKIKAAVEDVRSAITGDSLARKIQEAIDVVDVSLDTSVENTVDLSNNKSVAVQHGSVESEDDTGPFRSSHPTIGDHIEVFWPLDNQYYPGVVASI